MSQPCSEIPQRNSPETSQIPPPPAPVLGGPHPRKQAWAPCRHPRWVTSRERRWCASHLTCRAPSPAPRPPPRALLQAVSVLKAGVVSDPLCITRSQEKANVLKECISILTQDVYGRCALFCGSFLLSSTAPTLCPNAGLLDSCRTTGKMRAVGPSLFRQLQ